MSFSDLIPYPWHPELLAVQDIVTGFPWQEQAANEKQEKLSCSWLQPVSEVGRVSDCSQRKAHSANYLSQTILIARCGVESKELENSFFGLGKC